MALGGFEMTYNSLKEPFRVWFIALALHPLYFV